MTKLVSVSLLGKPRVHLDSGDLAFIPDLRYQCLAYLAYEGDWVRRDDLIYLFWPDTSQAKARHNLRQLLLRIRKFGWLQALESTPQQLRWQVETDVATFKEKLRIQAWGEAIASYGGPLMIAFDDGPPEYETWLAFERADLAGAYREAALSLATELKATERYAQAAELLEKLHLEDSTDEDLFRRYLETLALSEHRSRVTSAYERFHHTLKRELDAEPDAGTQRLVETLQRGDASTAQPTVVVSPDRVKAFIPKPLPLSATRFIGRKKELEQISRQLADPDCRLLTLVGSGGIGKTRLALEVARRLEANYQDGVVFISFESARTPELMESVMADTLGFSFFGPQPAREQLLDFLQTKRMLLVMDNLEHLLAGTPLISELLEKCSKLKVVATSREVLNLQAEYVFDVRGLSLKQEVSETSDAERLFIQLARQRKIWSSKKDLVFDDKDLIAITEICGQVEGMPLAIELAAVWISVMKPGAIAAQVKHNLGLLETHIRDVPDRHRSIRAAFARSWELLREQERKVYRQCAVFRGGFTSEAAHEVIGAIPTVLRGLVDKSLLRVDETGRFDRHPLLYEYAREKFLEDPKKQLIEDRHANYFATFTMYRLHEEYGPDHKIIIDALERELPNVRAAWPNILARLDYEQIQRVRNGLYRYHRYRGNPQEAITMLTKALPVLNEPEAQATLVNVLRLLIMLHRKLGQLEQAVTFVEQAIEIAKHSGDPTLKSSLASSRASLALSLNNYKDAARYYKEALDTSRREGNRVSEAITLANLGWTHTLSGDYQMAEHYIRDSLAIDRSLDNLEGTGSDLVILAELYLATNRLKEAERAYEEALALGRKIAFHHLIAQALTGLGHCALEARQYNKAEAFLSEADEVLQKANSFQESIEVEYNLARVETALGCYDAARDRLRAAFAKATMSHILSLVLEGLLVFAELYACTNRIDLTYIALNYVCEHPRVSAPKRARARMMLSETREALLNSESVRQLPAETLSLEEIARKLIGALAG